MTRLPTQQTARRFFAVPVAPVPGPPARSRACGQVRGSAGGRGRPWRSRPRVERLQLSKNGRPELRGTMTSERNQAAEPGSRRLAFRLSPDAAARSTNELTRSAPDEAPRVSRETERQRVSKKAIKTISYKLSRLACGSPDKRQRFHSGHPRVITGNPEPASCRQPLARELAIQTNWMVHGNRPRTGASRSSERSARSGCACSRRHGLGRATAARQPWGNIARNSRGRLRDDRDGAEGVDDRQRTECRSRGRATSVRAPKPQRARNQSERTHRLGPRSRSTDD